MPRENDPYESADSTQQARAADGTNPIGGQEPTDPDPHPDTALSVARGAFYSSLALVILHLALFFLIDCLRWINLILAIYHAGFAVFAYRSLQDPTGSDEPPADPDQHVDS